MTQPTNPPPQGQVQHLNPDGLAHSPAFTQMVVTSGPVKTLYIGMQNAVDESGSLIGEGDIALQTEQVLKNIEICLKAGGATKEHIVLWRIYVVEGQPIQPGFEVGMRWWGDLPHPPANTVLIVSQIAPGYLVGIEAIAVVPL